MKLEKWAKKWQMVQHSQPLSPGGVVMMPFEVVFCRDVIRNTTTLAMTRHGEVLFPILLEYPVGLFLSRFRSRRVRRTTSYLTVYEPVLYEVLRLADGASVEPRYDMTVSPVFAL